MCALFNSGGEIGHRHAFKRSTILACGINICFPSRKAKAEGQELEFGIFNILEIQTTTNEP